MYKDFLILNKFLNLVGLVTSFYLGYAGYLWYWLLLPGLIFATAWSVVRSGQVMGIFYSDGVFGVFKLLLIQVIFTGLVVGGGIMLIGRITSNFI